MELHSPVAAKKLWSYLRVIFFMMRKGLTSKRKLVMDMNLMMKRGKLLGKSLGNLMFHHHHHHQSKSLHPSYGLREYEFSCSNSPNPVFFHGKRRHNYFPCLSAIVEEPDETPRPAVALPRIEYASPCSFFSLDLAPGERRSPLPSPFSVRISNFSADGEELGQDPNDQRVDDEAEEFIKMFYEQLRAQSHVALLQYQEMEYQEMLARGA